jgi:Transglycosylase SLT domain
MTLTITMAFYEQFVVPCMAFFFPDSTKTEMKASLPSEPEKKEAEQGLCSCVIGVCDPSSKVSHNYVFDKQMYDMRCDTLAQVRFWRDIMNLHEDSCIINVATYRNQLVRIHNKEWGSKSDESKTCFKDSVRSSLGLDSTHRILLTTGKRFFYDFDRAFGQFEKGINCFIDNGVDPWYAQSILLIESPNKLQKSNAGAYGPFQLMKNVARLFGLKVNRQMDERADFERSAYAASSLIKKICIPKTREMLDSLGITNYNETDLWFRLLVMHSYHAGSGNVKLALKTFNPTTGDMNLIYNLWKAETRHFKSASQNYSQLVLAAHLEMNKRMQNQIFYLSGPLAKSTSLVPGN